MLRENLKPATPRRSEDLGAQIDAPALLSHRSFFARFLSKKFLFVHELGFRIQQAGKETCILYSEIDGISIQSVDLFSYGIQYATGYKIYMHASGKTILMNHLVTDDRKNPFLIFVNKLIQVLADQFEMKKHLRANDWVLDEQGLRWRSGNLPWTDVGYVDVVDRQICVWKSTDVYPCFKIDVASSQAVILNEILERHTKKHPQKLSPESLGRFLFSRRTNKTIANITLALAVLFLASGLLLLFRGGNYLLLAFLLLFLGGPVSVYILFALRKTFHFFQNGIIQEPGHRVLFYDRCDSLMYDTNLQFINALYAFTRIRMDIQGSGTEMKVRIQCYGNDAEVDQARVESSMKISQRLYQKVATQGEIKWGKWARIAQHEVHYLSTPLLGSNVRFTMPFTQSISYSIDSGKFYLFRAGEANPLFEMDCNEENFYPGLFLLLKLVAEH